MEVSFNEGLTWTPIWTTNDVTVPAGSWYITTIDLADFGYTSGDAIFSAHKTDAYGWAAYFDDWYIGPADMPTSNLAISTPIEIPAGLDKANMTESEINAIIDGNEMLSYTSLASSVDTRNIRAFETFKVSLDDIFSGNTEDTFYDYETAETLVEGTEYVAKVESVYTTGISDPMYYTFTYHACDYYNSVADFTAERVMGTMDVALAWTNDDADVDADAFIGTNVYRDGELIDFVPAGTETYTDDQVASGTYNYCVTQLYESDAQSCEVCGEVIMTAGGYVNGFVTSFDPADVPIEGATVAMVGETDSYVFTTDSTGYYEGEVVEGTYTYTVSAPEYETQELADVFIDFGATVTNDFALLEHPYPVGEVVATELSDNAVQVNWSGQGTDVTEEWLIYDNDALVYDGIGAEAADYSLIWASKWEPAELTEYGTGYVTKVAVYQINIPCSKLSKRSKGYVWRRNDSTLLTGCNRRTGRWCMEHY